MYLVDNLLISEDLLEEHFACDLKHCRGACCWEGDWGAPLEDWECTQLFENREILRSFVSAGGNRTIDNHGTSVFYPEPNIQGTPLVEGGACAYLQFDADGTGRCSIETAYQAGAIDFQKPISCHLYPVRHSKVENSPFEALNYEKWDICKRACDQGVKMKISLFRFVKEALIRKFGKTFYAKLEDLYQDKRDK